MKVLLSLPALLLLAAAPLFAQDARLSPDRLGVFARHGYFTPAFQDAARALVASHQTLVAAKAENDQLKGQLPSLQEKLQAAQAKVALLRQELDTYEHADDLDFAALQAELQRPGAALPGQLALAQAFVWGYPGSPHQAEAQRLLRQLEKTIADKQQADLVAAAAQAAAQADLQRRAAAHQLSLNEWKLFLHDMSQEDVLKNLGHPQSAGDDFWIYRGDWVADPVTQQKVGLLISFNGTRVNTVTEALSPP
jgi:peptidoglycan hydrolase CwlO-like protein